MKVDGTVVEGTKDEMDGVNFKISQALVQEISERLMTGIESSQIKNPEGGEVSEEEAEYIKADSFCQMSAQIGTMMMANALTHHSLYFKGTDEWKDQLYKAVDQMFEDLKFKVEQDLEHAQNEAEEESNG